MGQSARTWTLGAKLFLRARNWQMDSEFFYMDGVGGRGSCGADGLIRGRLPYTRGGRLGSLPSMARLGGKFGEGRAGAPGDQALLHRAVLCNRGRSAGPLILYQVQLFISEPNSLAIRSSETPISLASLVFSAIASTLPFAKPFAIPSAKPSALPSAKPWARPSALSVS